MRVSEIRVNQIRVNQGLGVITIQIGKNYWDLKHAGKVRKGPFFMKSNCKCNVGQLSL